MSDAPPPPPPLASANEERIRRRVAIGAGAFAVVVIAGVAAYTFLRETGPDHPDAWDERVVDLVAFVERERELEFDHPVYVDFLTPEEYSDLVRTDAADLTDEDADHFDDLAASLRSLGVLDGEVDLFEASNELSDSGTLAYYSHTSRTITVRGTEVSVDLEVTLVHELVHALQDQHFDLGRIDEMDSTGAAAAFRAVVEGDASLVSRYYVDQLDAADLDAYLDATGAQLEAGPLDAVPTILTASTSSVYALGEPFVAILQQGDGWTAVDAALREPPTTELELFRFLAFVDGFTEVEVEPVELADGHELVDEGDFGAISLYLLLAARMDPVTAMDATDMWAGDAYLTSTAPDGRVCTELAVATADDRAADVLDAALTAWVAGAARESDAGVERDGNVMTLHSCDPGTDVEIEMVTDPLDAVVVASMRSVIIQSIQHQDLSMAEAECAADEVLAVFPVELLTARDATQAQIGKFWSLVDRGTATCRRAAA